MVQLTKARYCCVVREIGDHKATKLRLSCSDNAVYADIRGCSSGRGVKRQWGCRRRQFSVLSVAVYFFRNFRDKEGVIIMSICNPMGVPACNSLQCKVIDLEWPWVATSCQNLLSASTIRVFDFQKSNYVKSNKYRHITYGTYQPIQQGWASWVGLNNWLNRLLRRYPFR